MYRLVTNVEESDSPELVLQPVNVPGYRVYVANRPLDWQRVRNKSNPHTGTGILFQRSADCGLW